VQVDAKACQHIREGLGVQVAQCRSVIFVIFHEQGELVGIVNLCNVIRRLLDALKHPGRVIRGHPRPRNEGKGFAFPLRSAVFKPFHRDALEQQGAFNKATTYSGVF
jgi:hypothetical protein